MYIRTSVFVSFETNLIFNSWHQRFFLQLEMSSCWAVQTLLSILRLFKNLCNDVLLILLKLSNSKKSVSTPPIEFKDHRHYQMSETCLYIILNKIYGHLECRTKLNAMNKSYFSTTSNYIRSITTILNLVDNIPYCRNSTNKTRLMLRWM